MVACILACLVLSVAVMVRRRAFFQEESSCLFVRDAPDHCAAPQNPCEAIPRDGSSDQSVGCLELHGEWDMHRVAVRPHSSAHVPGTVPGHHNGVGPDGVGKAQSAKASSMVLMLFLLLHRQAPLLKSPATKSTCSSSITARIVGVASSRSRAFWHNCYWCATTSL